MGLVTAGNEFTGRVDEAMYDTPNLKRVVEDILIYNSDYATHREHVIDVIKRCEQLGITLHAKKCAFGTRAAKWFGFQITFDGYIDDPDLCVALTKFPTPKTKTDVRSICGLANQF